MLIVYFTKVNEYMRTSRTMTRNVIHIRNSRNTIQALSDELVQYT